MNKREKKKLKNKRQRQNKKGKYFQPNYDYEDYPSAEQQVVVTKVVDPEKKRQNSFRVSYSWRCPTSWENSH